MAGQLDVIGHDGDKIGVAGAQVSILQVTYCIIFPGEAHRFVTTVHIPTGMKLRKMGSGNRAIAGRCCTLSGNRTEKGRRTRETHFTLRAS